MRLIFYLLTALLFLQILTACGRQEANTSATVTAAVQTALTERPAPSVEITRLIEVTREVEVTRETEVTRIVEVIVTPTATPATPQERADFDADGRLLLGDNLLLDPAEEVPGCFGGGEVSYAPGGDRFAAVLSCFEGDNEAFLFRADGSDRRPITGEWDYVNYFDYEWSADGASFIYQRVNSCCVSAAEIPPEAPLPGRVRYDVNTGNKVLLSRFMVVDVAADDTLNVRAGPGTENEVVGELPPDAKAIEITGPTEVTRGARWAPIHYENITGWVHTSFIAPMSP